MIREITIGQYYFVDSLIHRLDPRVKLFATLGYVITLFLINSWWGYFLAAGVLLLYVKLSQVPWSFMLRGMKAILFLLIFSAIFNLFLTQGEVIWSWKFLQITQEGAVKAGQITFRLILLIMGSSMLTYTSTPNQLTDAMEKSLGFLNKIRVPVHEIAMMMSIALRFIPILLEETDKIMKAQMVRGADFEEGPLIQRVKNMVPLLVPLFVSAIRRASDLALAMEARCYHGSEGRTKMKPLKYNIRDYIMYLFVISYLVAIVSLSVMEW